MLTQVVLKEWYEYFSRMLPCMSASIAGKPHFECQLPVQRNFSHRIDPDIGIINGKGLAVARVVGMYNNKCFRKVFLFLEEFKKWYCLVP